MKKLLLILFFFTLFVFASEESTSQGKIKQINNVWLKTYSNYKNYNIILNNIIKVEQDLQNIRNKNSIVKIQELNNKVLIYKSKLTLYEKNNSFDELIKDYRYELRDITIYDFLFSISLQELKKKIIKYEVLKKEFYDASIFLQQSYDKSKESLENRKRVQLLQEEIEYFSEYSENVEKMKQNLLELEDEVKENMMNIKTKFL